jgi:hypothetical protein
MTNVQNAQNKTHVVHIILQIYEQSVCNVRRAILMRTHPITFILSVYEQLSKLGK